MLRRDDIGFRASGFRVLGLWILGFLGFLGFQGVRV
jgi:hypothetical protein